MSEERTRLPDSGPDVLAPGASNTALIARALEERWAMTPEMRKAATARQVRIAIDPNKKDREATRAYLALVKADMANIAEKEKEEKKKTEQHLHLHQHNETVEYSKIPLEELKRIRAELLALGGTTATGIGSGDLSGKPV